MHTQSGHLLCHWFVLFKTHVADLGPLSTSNEWRLKLHFQEGDVS